MNLNKGILFFMIFFLMSCHTAKKKATIVTSNKDSTPEVKITLDTLSVSSAVNTLYRTTPTQIMDLIHTNLYVKFNWEKHECIGSEEIICTPHFYNTDSILLDTKSTDFTEITITDTKKNSLEYTPTYFHNVLKLTLKKNITPNDTITITLQYVAKPDNKERGGSAAIKDDKGLYFINTDFQEPYKPRQLWTQGETEANSCWFPTIDKPNQKCTFNIAITTEDSLTTLSNGILTHSTKFGNERTDYWKMDKPMSPYLVMMAVGNFKKTSHTLNGKEISYYLEPNYHPYADSIFAHTEEMINFFSEKLQTPYPWQKYAQIIVRDYVSGAMENTSATLYGEFVQKNYRELIDNNNDGIIAHELFHQWFGDLVTCESWSHLTLNEGFATYSDQLWNEYKYGTDAALRVGYNSINNYLNYTKNNIDAPIVSFYFRNQEQLFNTITYQKGSRVLHLLRTEIGDNAFFAGLKKYLSRYAYANAEIDDLRNCFEEITGKDLRPFFMQWFLKSGHPNLHISTIFNDTTQKVSVTIKQTQHDTIGFYKCPLTIHMVQGDKEAITTTQIISSKKIITLSYLKNDGSQPSIYIDPFATFIGKITEEKSFKTLQNDFTNASNYVEKIRVLQQCKSSIQNDTATQILRAALHDKNEYIRENALNMLDWKRKSFIDSNKNLLVHIMETDPYSYNRAKAISILSDLKDNALLNSFSTLCYDSSYNVAGEALYAIENIAHPHAFELASRLQQNPKGRLLTAITHIFSLQKDTTLRLFYEKNIPQYFNSTRASLLNNYGKYASQFSVSEMPPTCINTLIDYTHSNQLPTVKLMAVTALKKIETKWQSDYDKTTDEEEKKHTKETLNQLSEKIKHIIESETDESTIRQYKINGFIIK